MCFADPVGCVMSVHYIGRKHSTGSFRQSSADRQSADQNWLFNISSIIFSEFTHSTVMWNLIPCILDIDHWTDKTNVNENLSVFPGLQGKHMKTLEKIYRTDFIPMNYV